ncbi:flagellar protein FlaG [Pseudomonas sp. NW5]|uniref:flagellar protein FlaG n=1 Tax=Pseudomonas sp. NW5 TaxID=2934934 RepID=UPI00202275B7|nr:flagellar protein FlaG [Pseudomonas sp. NW5]MCL7461901.1 flagellar protein FlaG [Pseudomonas sp. NW5]
MSSPLLDAGSVNPNPATANITPRQRLEEALSQKLPAPGTADAQSASNQAALITRDELVKPVQRINETLSSFGVEFQLSDPGQRLVTRVIDRESGDLIRQIPSDEVLRLAERLAETGAGFLLDQQA